MMVCLMHMMVERVMIVRIVRCLRRSFMMIESKNYLFYLLTSFVAFVIYNVSIFIHSAYSFENYHLPTAVTDL